ncbi:inverted formin-2-like [Alexandromys fortis]|uniref:inverted formin-2-like n=1 Tax=Alexandromys fortis TaxID=100897 RepID=UPI00215351DA|nr:inverted formin-2-like [Microtus fortis]
MATLRPYKQLPLLSLANMSPRRPRALAAPLAATLWNSFVLPPSPAPPSPLPATATGFCAFPPESPALGRTAGTRLPPEAPPPRVRNVHTARRHTEEGRVTQRLPLVNRHLRAM